MSPSSGQAPTSMTAEGSSMTMNGDRDPDMASATIGKFGGESVTTNSGNNMASATTCTIEGESVTTNRDKDGGIAVKFLKDAFKGLQLGFARTPVKPVNQGRTSNSLSQRRTFWAMFTGIIKIPQSPMLREYSQRKYFTSKRYPNSSHRSNASGFPLFRELPTELRLKIWEAARPDPRVIKLSQAKPNEHGLSYPYSKAKIPNLLHACRESREVAVQWYKLCFSSYFGPRVTYFDLSSDILYIKCEKCKGAWCKNYKECEMPLPCILWRPEAKRIALEFDASKRPPPIVPILFRRTEELLLVDAQHGLDSRAEANLSDFITREEKWSWQEGKDIKALYLESPLSAFYQEHAMPEKITAVELKQSVQ